jgi:hypothetical protein
MPYALLAAQQSSNSCETTGKSWSPTKKDKLEGNNEVLTNVVNMAPDDNDTCRIAVLSTPKAPPPSTAVDRYRKQHLLAETGPPQLPLWAIVCGLGVLLLISTCIAWPYVNQTLDDLALRDEVNSIEKDDVTAEGSTSDVTAVISTRSSSSSSNDAE